MAHNALVCRQCGNLRSVCSDPTIDWHPDTATCWPTATQQWGLRRLAKKHENAKPDDTALHPLDGVTLWVSQVEPEQDPFATRR